MTGAVLLTAMFTCAGLGHAGAQSVSGTLETGTDLVQTATDELTSAGTAAVSQGGSEVERTAKEVSGTGDATVKEVSGTGDATVKEGLAAVNETTDVAGGGTGKALGEVEGTVGRATGKRSPADGAGPRSNERIRAEGAATSGASKRSTHSARKGPGATSASPRQVGVGADLRGWNDDPIPDRVASRIENLPSGPLDHFAEFVERFLALLPFTGNSSVPFLLVGAVLVAIGSKLWWLAKEEQRPLDEIGGC